MKRFNRIIFAVLAVYLLVAIVMAASGSEEYILPAAIVVILILAAVIGMRIAASRKVAPGTDSDDPAPQVGLDPSTPLGDTPEHSDVSSAIRR